MKTLVLLALAAGLTLLSGCAGASLNLNPDGTFTVSGTIPTAEK
tara:strand:+ start:86 stop:217 length:132 start_codon:yes stop_codon:yes gene_type:complete